MDKTKEQFLNSMNQAANLLLLLNEVELSEVAETIDNMAFLLIFIKPDKNRRVANEGVENERI